MSNARLILFVQTLVFFVLGIYLSIQGIPSDENSATLYAGEQIMDSLADVSDSPEVDKITNDMKSNFRLFGNFLVIASILELIGLFISLFKR